MALVMKVYIYKTQSNGYLKCYEGEIKKAKFNDTWYYGAEQGKHGQCGPDEGVVYNSVLWLRKRDDAKATNIFTMHYQDEILKLRTRTRKYELLIEKLHQYDREALTHIEKLHQYDREALTHA